MNKQELYEVVRDAEVSAFDAWQETDPDDEKLNNYHTAFLTLHFLSQPLMKILKKMNVYFDTEFTGLHKGTTLISIGLVSEDGKTFYGELTDYDKSQVNDWIQENVIDNLLYSPMYHGCMGGEANTVCVGNKERIRRELEQWLSQFDDVQLVSDVSHYDMVLFIDVFGDAFSIPKNVSPSCHDINQDIARIIGCTDREAFDISREELLKELAPDVKIGGEKHNSL